MKKAASSRYKKILKWASLLILAPFLVSLTGLAVLFFNQDAWVQEIIEHANQDLNGSIRISDSHISPFAQFPYISIDLENLELFEGKNLTEEYKILEVDDAHVGFNLFELLWGSYDIKAIKLERGTARLVQHEDGALNIVNAFGSNKPSEEVAEDIHLALKSIRLRDIHVTKLNEASQILLDIQINKAKSIIKLSDDLIFIDLSADFLLSVAKEGMPTIFKNKHLGVDTELRYIESSKTLLIDPTTVILEKSDFDINGTVVMNEDVEADLKFEGKKPDFNLLVALAPEELGDALATFENRGKIYFSATVKGKTANGNQPSITAEFGCEEGFLKNTLSNKELDRITFKGSFTNGENRNASSMKLELENFSAQPDAGLFKGKLRVENFSSPEIDMNIVSDFDLNFLAAFLNMNELRSLSGRIKLSMNFRDIIDLNNPEKSIERFNESYFSELSVENLRFKSPAFPLSFENVNLKASVEGHEATIERFDLRVGGSDLQITGSISDLPAILHHSDIPVTAELNVLSKKLDLKELTSGNPKKKPVDEEIENLKLKLRFVSSAKAFTESENFPEGNFYIEDFFATLKKYPHSFHDFHADINVRKNHLEIKDFSGMIDKSDFHFSGKAYDYEIWLKNNKSGDAPIDFDLRSDRLLFESLFSYGGENFIPEEYRHEEITGLKATGKVIIHFKNGIPSADLNVGKLEGKMKVHPLTLKLTKGNIRWQDSTLKAHNITGNIGHSAFRLGFAYSLRKTKGKNEENFITLLASKLDMDELLNYTPSETQKTDHDSVFSLYDLEFPNMHLSADIENMNYHRFLLQNLKADITTHKDHTIELKYINFDAAGGHFIIRGHLSGKDKTEIYFKPEIAVRSVDLDKFMFKFDNFGQDHVISENLHGKFTGKITGKIHLHADLVPKIDDSEIRIEVLVTGGKLENYAPMKALSDFFKDNNLSRVLFDSLKNTLQLKNGVLEIPQMTINSSLGFLEIAGKQHINGAMNMDYTLGIPWKMVTKTASQKLFNKKEANTDRESDDEIQYKKQNSRFLWVKISGNPDNYKVSLSKKPKS